MATMPATPTPSADIVMTERRALRHTLRQAMVSSMASLLSLLQAPQAEGVVGHVDIELDRLVRDGGLSALLGRVGLELHGEGAPADLLQVGVRHAAREHALLVVEPLLERHA